jgi:hypothetical protein
MSKKKIPEEKTPEAVTHPYAKKTSTENTPKVGTAAWLLQNYVMPEEKNPYCTEQNHSAGQSASSTPAGQPQTDEMQLSGSTE